MTLDVDSSESPVHGTQEQSAYNGHFESICYHPLFVFKTEGDCLAAKLRPGNVHSAEGWDEILLPILDRYRGRVAFEGGGAGGQQGIYTNLGSSLTRVIDRSTPLDGRIPLLFALESRGFDGASFAFVVIFRDFSTAVFRADPVDFDLEEDEGRTDEEVRSKGVEKKRRCTFGSP